MNLFNYINKKKIPGVILPTAVLFTFVSMMVTVGYMERALNKKINLDLRIAKAKARLNAESGVAVTISGPTDNGEFMPSIGSSYWPLDTDDDSGGNADIIDIETFEGFHKPENINDGIANSSNNTQIMEKLLEGCLKILNKQSFLIKK